MNWKIFAAAAGACLILLQVACGGGSSSPAAPSPPPPSLGVKDPALVGMWTGTVDGSFGPEELYVQLTADGTSQFAGSGRYCRADGEWGVSGTEFTTRGTDCTGTIVTMVAPASGTKLTGTWRASSGRSGTFSVTKQ